MGLVMLQCILLLQPHLLMEALQHTSPIKRTINQMLANLASPHHLHVLEEALLQLPLEGEQPEMESLLEGERQAESLPYASSGQAQQQPPLQIEQQRLPLPVEQVVSMPYSASLPVLPEMQLPQEPPAPSRKEQPLTEPPLIAGRRNATEQSSQRSRTNQQSSRKGQRRSSEEESINLQLTQKTKRSKNMSFTQNRADSLLYSDATLLYSNDATGFDREASIKQQQLPLRTESHNVVIKQVEDEGEGEISARMERAESRECDRMQTESQQPSERGLRLQTQEEGNVFQTQIEEYKGKISKIRELKQNKKRKLQAQLRRVNNQLEDLTKREQQAGPIKPNNFQSRVKINDNAEAKVKAERLVGRLHQDKRSRQEMQLGELQAIGKNINDYMEELMKERYKNEERIKQRKKLEIIDRMRQQEVRKMEEQQKKDKNLQFVHQLRTSNSKPDLQPQQQQQQYPQQQQQQYPQQQQQQQQQQRRSSDHPVPHHPPPPPPDPFKNKERSYTKKSEPSEETPELSRKKAYLKKIRNISFKKERQDVYEQLLN